MTEEEEDRILELAHGQIEASLTRAEMEELNTALASQAEARRLYSTFLHDQALLHHETLGRSSQETTELGEPSFDPHEPFEPVPQRRWPTAPQALAAAAMVCLLAMVAVRPHASAPATYATLTSSEAARWESGDFATVNGARLGQGHLRLAEGLATLRFDSTAEITLEGPAELEIVDQMHCLLHGGTAVANVGERGKGFVISTPTANVIDHGTRFAVNVERDSGSTQTQVFEGLVEVELPGRGESIQLTAGQINHVSGGELGNASVGPNEASWASPASTRRVIPANWKVVSTAEGNGDDGYATMTPAHEHNSTELLLLKHGNQLDGPHRKAWLRFDLTPFERSAITEAILFLQFAPTGWGLASWLVDAEFDVYGITDSNADQWSSETLLWETAPGNHPSGGDATDATCTQHLGSFIVPRGVQSGSFTLTSPELTQFLREDKDSLASLIIVRKTIEEQDGGLVHGIAGSRHPSLAPPRLALKLD